MYLYALDLSMECSGIVIFNMLNGEPVLIEHVNRVSSGYAPNAHGKNLRNLARKLVELRKQYPPHMVVMEAPFNQYNKSTEVLYKVHGIVNYIFFDVQQKTIVNTHWKKVILNGKATKEECKAKVLEYYPNLKFRTLDESDAFCLGLCHLIDNNIVKWDNPNAKTTATKTTKNRKTEATTKK